MHERQTEKAEIRQQHRMQTTAEMTRKIKEKGRMDANNIRWVGELLAADCKETRGSTQNGKNTMQRRYKWLY